MESVLFATFGLVALASAVLAVTRKNAVAAACWLVVMFFGLAGVFVLLEAYFVAAIQILVYAGAIMVLFLFVIMLLDLRSEELRAQTAPRMKAPGIVLAGLFLVGIVAAVVRADAGEGVARRVTASVTLPMVYPPPATPAAEPPKPYRPDPVPVALVERRAQDVAADPALRAVLRAADRDARLRAGTTPAHGKDRGVLVALFPRRHEIVAWFDADADGVFLAAERLGSATFDPGVREASASFDLPGGVADHALRVTATSGLSAAPSGGPDGSPYAIGKSLFDEWLLPFEVTSVLLLAAIFGAVVLTKRRLS